MSRTLEVEAYCSECHRVTAHLATFTGRFLKERTCQDCGAMEKAHRSSLLRAYADELLDRALSKPYRLREEWKKDRRDTLHSLPSRILKRPLREARFLSELLEHPGEKTGQPAPKPESGEPEQGSRQ